MFSPSSTGVSDSQVDKPDETSNNSTDTNTETRAIVFHPHKKGSQVDMRDLMIYQQVRRIDELEQRISELQLELQKREKAQDQSD